MHRLAVGAVGAAAFVLAASVPEGAHADSTQERTEEAISRVANGDWTKDDLTLIKSQPEVAGRVPDPSRKPDVVARSAPVPTGATATLSAAVSTCKAYWVNYSYYSLLGSKIYTWQKYVSLCYNGSVVTSVNERYDWLPYRQSMVIVRERTIDEQSGKGTWLQHPDRAALGVLRRQVRVLCGHLPVGSDEDQRERPVDVLRG